MTHTFFHIDRGSELELGQVLDLDHRYAWESDLEEVLTGLYPEGLSHHGHVYTQGGAEGYDIEFFYESFFELVRLNQFPDRPSRFQSIFGFKQLERAEEFTAKYAEEPSIIWKVETSSYFRGDMRLVEVADFPRGLKNAAHYWRGETWREDPYWEYLLEPPVTLVEKVATIYPAVE